MKTRIFRNMLTAVLPFFALALFSTTISVAQMPTLRSNGKIAFSSQEIYVMNADGSNQTKLTNHSAGGQRTPGLRAVAWSPDGAKIAFTSYLSAYPFNTEIYVMNADGSNQINLTNNQGWDESPTWSPDGARIAFTSQRVNEDTHRSFAPQLYVMNADGSNQIRLTNHHDAGVRFPAWSPDGTRIAVATYQLLVDGGISVPDEIYVINVDGSDQRNLTNSPTLDGAPAWSPDGSRIAFTRQPFFNAADDLDVGRLDEVEIYVMNADGSNLMRLTNNTAEDFDPSWSPDGAKIAFASDRDGSPPYRNSEIYVMNADGSNQTRLTNNAQAYSFGPAWQSLPPTAPNAIDDAQFFARQHYLDFLNRDPDAGGLAFWTNEIALCGSDQECIDAKRLNVSAAFFFSIEFQETGYLVYRMYKAAYGNLPNAPVPIKFSEFLPDTRQIGQAVIVNQAGWETVLENNKRAFAAEFVQRSRFTSDYPTSFTPDQFVDQLFMNAGMTPAATDRASAINEFGGAGTSADAAARARAMRRVAENSTLKQQEFNRAFVLMQYFGYLRRNPYDTPEPTLDYQGYNFWLGKLNQFNGNYVDAEMVKAFLVSGEYRQRFAQ
ncbi:MAG: hypothetical protein ABJC10_07135 [Acidobacteriota bacterium]